MKLAKVCCVLFGMLLFSGCIKSDDDNVEEYVKVGDPVPVFSVSGETRVYSSTEAGGKITLICFFTTWCPNCHDELPKIQYVWDALSEDSGFELAAIGREEDLATIRKFWGENSLTMPYYEDPGRDAYKKFASATIPRCYIIGRNETVLEVVIGETAWTKEQWLAKVRSYVETP